MDPYDEMDERKETGPDLPASFYETQEEKEAREKRLWRKGFRKGTLLGIVFVLVVEAAVLYLPSLLSGGSASLSTASVLDSETEQKLGTVLTLLEYYYYEGDEISVEDLQDGIFSGLVDAVGDSYTVYYTAEEMENQTISSSGSYSGIGAAITQEADTGWPMIYYTYTDSPAEEAGLQTGDLILQVDDMEVTSDTSTSDVASAIRGEEGTSVYVVISRDGEEIGFDIVRADIETPTVESQMLTDEVGYIYIVQFSSNTGEQFAAAYEALLEEGMTSLVIDLRYNGGGTVSSCVEIMDYILPEGVTLTMTDAQGEVDAEYTSDAEQYIDLPIALLVNGSTASASEIVTAALQDYDYAVIIGTTTYGKGVYQQIYTLDDGSGVKVTAGMFYSPLGNNYNGVGIEPDIVLEYENTAGDDASYSVETDNQILKAIEVLTE